MWLLHIIHCSVITILLQDSKPSLECSAEGEMADREGKHGVVAASAEIVIVSILSKDLPPPTIREITQICKCAIPINLIHIIMQRKEIEFKKKLPGAKFSSH